MKSFAAIAAAGLVASAHSVVANEAIEFNYQQHEFLAATNNESTSACPQPGGAHIIVARASLEAPGFGIIGAVKDAVLDAVPGSTAEAVEYPATLDAYQDSETQGVVAMRVLVNNFIAKCSGVPLVLMGYSQGAQVSADTVAGQLDVAFTANSTNGLDEPLAASTLARTAAVIIMGDPSFNTTETFHVGNATKHGLFPRQNVPNFGISNIASRTQSYCDIGDPYCASGNFSTLAVHLGYVKEYGTQAGNFTVKQIKDWYAHKSNSTSPVGTASATASGVLVSGTAASTGFAVGPTGTGATKTGSAPSKTSATSPITSFTGAASSLAAFGWVALSGSLFAFLL